MVIRRLSYEENTSEENVFLIFQWSCDQRQGTFHFQCIVRAAHPHGAMHYEYMPGRNRRQYERIQAFTVLCPPVTLLSIHTFCCGLPLCLNIIVNTSLPVETKISSPIIKLHVLSSLFLKRGNPKTRSSSVLYGCKLVWCCWWIHGPYRHIYSKCKSKS